MRRALAWAVLACLTARSLPARAQEAERCDASVRQVRGVLDDNARRMRVWYWAWMATGTAFLGGSAALAAVSSGNEQKDYIAGALTSVFIPGLLLLHPPLVLGDSRRLDDRIALTSVDGRLGDPCVVLPFAQQLLARDAQDEAFATGWFAHAFVVGGNMAVGLLLGLGFGDWAGFVKQAVGGSVVGEIQILTLPTGAIRARGLGLAGEF